MVVVVVVVVVVIESNRTYLFRSNIKLYITFYSSLTLAGKQNNVITAMALLIVPAHYRLSIISILIVMKLFTLHSLLLLRASRDYCFWHLL